MNFQYDQLGSMRQTLFQYIKPCHSDDLEPCFNLLQSLTNNGSNLYLIEEQIGNLKISLDSTLFLAPDNGVSWPDFSHKISQGCQK